MSTFKVVKAAKVIPFERPPGRTQIAQDGVARRSGYVPALKPLLDRGRLGAASDRDIPQCVAEVLHGDDARDVQSPTSRGIILTFRPQAEGTARRLVKLYGRGIIAPDMPDDPKSDYDAALVRRVKELRQRARLSQAEIATVLGIERETYKKYEQRTPLPQYLYRRFVIVTQSTLDELVNVEKPLPRRAHVKIASR